MPELGGALPTLGTAVTKLGRIPARALLAGPCHGACG